MLVTLGGMVEHHVQNHANAVFMQHTYRIAQLLFTPWTQARIQHHHAHRIVAPRIAQTERWQMTFVHPRGDRHQFDCIHAHLLEMC